MAKILVTDDEEDMRMALMNTLMLAGYDVIDAESGRQALEMLGKEHVDLMLLDIRLPDMDGVQILTKVKETHPHVPVIMVTGFGSLETAVKTVQLGAADYVSKPFENKDLFSRIEKALGQKQQTAPSGPITSRLIKDIEGEQQAEVDGGPPRARKSFFQEHKKGIVVTAVLAAFLILGGLGGFFAYQYQKSAEVTFGIPTTHLSSIAGSSERLWLSDWFGQTVYECKIQEGQLVVRKSYQLGESRPTGMAFSGDALYVGDSWSRKLTKRALDANLSIVYDKPSPSKAPGALYFDGEYLWSTDTGDDKIFRHDGGPEFKVQRSFRARGTAPVGVAVKGGHIWIADADTKRIYKHRIDEDFKLAETFTYPLLEEQTRPLSAFLLTDKFVWFGFEGVNKIYRVRRGKLIQVQ